MRLNSLYRAAVVCLILTGFGCAKMVPPSMTTNYPAILDQLDPDVNQCLIVRPDTLPSTTIGPAMPTFKPDPLSTASLIAYGRAGKSWNGLYMMHCLVGKNGFAPQDQKVEGDGKTPSGIFAIGPVFGYTDDADTKMPFYRLKENDFWIDDPKSPDYNKMVSGAKPTVSHEILRRKDDAYKYGAIIEYNRNPIVPGKGSAIFLHVAEPTSTCTAGCVAIEEHYMKYLLAWLDPAQKPHIILNDPDTTSDFYDNTLANPKPK